MANERLQIREEPHQIQAFSELDDLNHHTVRSTQAQMPRTLYQSGLLSLLILLVCNLFGKPPDLDVRACFANMSPSVSRYWKMASPT